MMQYSLLDRRPEENCLDLLAQSKISVITRGTLAKGLLAGKPVQSYLTHDQALVKKAANQIFELGRKTNRSEAQIAAAFVLNHTTVASAVIGFRTIDQLNAFSSHVDLNLSHEEYDQLNIAIETAKYEAHR
jgi:aryl-alcohol dehydrogenase-like predicted oxidoreductase